jgi:hypothetical protein
LGTLITSWANGKTGRKGEKMKTLIVENWSGVKVMFCLPHVANITSKGKFIVVELTDGMRAEFLRHDVKLYFE